MVGPENKSANNETMEDAMFGMRQTWKTVVLSLAGVVIVFGAPDAFAAKKMTYEQADDLVGVASGATGNPAILVYSTRMAPTERPDIGYAMIFPSMTIVKVIAVQIVGLLAGAAATG